MKNYRPQFKVDWFYRTDGKKYTYPCTGYVYNRNTGEYYFKDFREVKECVTWCQKCKDCYAAKSSAT